MVGIEQNATEQYIKRNIIPHMRAPLPGKQANVVSPSVTELHLATHYGQVKKMICGIHLADNP